VKWGVVLFPGSNDERDALYALGSVLGDDTEALWHGRSDLGNCDAIVLPGGFSYGDYLRCGALARFSAILGAVERFAADGGPVLGICNGFQILCEAGLLPGALIRNSGLRFLCKPVALRVESTETAFSNLYEAGQTVTIPVKHGEGCFVADPATLEGLEQHGQIVFRYRGGAPNGSTNDIAGITNQAGNVVGLMPHPEHAVDPLLGCDDGVALFRSATRWLEAGGTLRRRA
jgi:phosphoribosylformylglycinamidine synthase I